MPMGRQAFILPVGGDKVLIQVSKSGKLFDVELGEAKSSVSNNGISILSAIIVFILSNLLIGAMSGGGLVGYCCAPLILAIAAYFVTPAVIKLMSKESGLNFQNFVGDILESIKSLFGRKDPLEDKLVLFPESESKTTPVPARSEPELKSDLGLELSTSDNQFTQNDITSDSQQDKIADIERMRNILNLATKSANFKYIEAYKEIAGSYQLELTTAYSEFGHRTYLRYEFTGDAEFIRIEIKHRFGYVDPDDEPNVVANQLMGLLRRNIGAFNGTTAFLGVEFEDGKFFATLGSFHHFVATWSDKDIASALTLHIFDIVTGLMTSDSSLTILKRFGE